jgi:uncharacterized protein
VDPGGRPNGSVSGVSTTSRTCALVVALGLLLVGCQATPTEVTADPAELAARIDPDLAHLDGAEVTIATADGAVTVEALVAEAAEDRQRGLMHVPHLPDGTGMLFVFADDRTGGFWMKDTLVALDIAFVDAAGTIVAIVAMDPCDEDPCPVHEPGAAYLTALEVPQGWFDAAGVAVGDELSWVRVPAADA